MVDVLMIVISKNKSLLKAKHDRSEYFFTS